MLSFERYLAQKGKLESEIDFWKQKYFYYKRMAEILDENSAEKAIIAESVEQANVLYDKVEKLVCKLRYLKNNLEVMRENN